MKNFEENCKPLHILTEFGCTHHSQHGNFFA